VIAHRGKQSRRSADSHVRVVIGQNFGKHADKAVRAPPAKFLNAPGLLTALDRIQVDKVNVVALNRHEAFSKPSASAGLSSELMRLSSFCISGSAAIAERSASHVSRLPAKPARTRVHEVFEDVQLRFGR